VYLTADTENVLDIPASSPQDILVIGGIVDRNRYKNATVLKAERIGMHVAQLPIGELMKMKSSKVLAVNHVFEILTQYFDHRDWTKAFKSVIPDRKKIADDSIE
jgi:tRNA (guanine9-N1)-methyltransferase